MIPRVRPSYTLAELRVALHWPRDAVAQFECALAGYFGVKHVLAFPYGRSAIFTTFRALGLSGEIVQPAYNCVVVAHATTLSGNQPIFVDCQSSDPNQDAEALMRKVNAHTVAAIPTSIFGQSFDAPAIVEGIRRKNGKTFVLIDCAQCFDARWNGELLAAQGDAAILAFGIGKAMTTLFGGALLTNRDDVAHAVRSYCNQIFRQPSIVHSLRRFAYFVVSWIAVTGSSVIVSDWLERSGVLQSKFVKPLRSRESIQLPPDSLTFLDSHQAAIGIEQLRRVSVFIQRRREVSEIYARMLGDLQDVDLPNWNEGATHTIYPLRLKESAGRPQLLGTLRHHGVQAGIVIDYVVPDLEPYCGHGDGGEFPNARDWAQRVLNLPNHPSLTDAQVELCAMALRDALATGNLR